MMRSSEAAERRSGAAKLLELPAGRARELVLPGFRDPDIEVRLHAARAAVSLGLTRVADEVLPWLQESDARLRIAGCDVVRASPTPEGVAALARVLSDAKPEVREAAARALGSIGGTGSVSPLLGRMDDASPRVRAVVLRSLGQLGDSRATIPILSKLQDPEPQVRASAARAVGALRDPRAASSLEVALSDKDADVVLAALEALGKTGASESVPVIAALLEEESSVGGRAVSSRSVREVGLTALGRLGTDDALHALVRALEREGPVPYDEEATALVRRVLRLAGARAEEPLLRAIAQPASARASSAAALALAQVASQASRGRVAEQLVVAARRGALDVVQAMHALGRLGERAALPFVLENVDAADAAVRGIAITIAGRLLEPSEPDGRVVDLVRVRLADPRLGMAERVALVRLLGRTGAPRAAPLLLSIVPPGRSPARAEPLGLRVAVLDALGDLGRATPAAEAVLLAELAHPNERVRAAAARALGRVGGDASLRTLLSRLVESASDDRDALASALSGALARASEPSLAPLLEAAVRSVRGPTRDALFEGVGRASAPWGLHILEAASRSDDPDDRRKAAEALGSRVDGDHVVRRLLGDPNPGVRANAAWSLASSRDPSMLLALRAAVADHDVAVAANAVTALTTVAGRIGAAGEVAPLLCELVDAPRAYVAHSALRGASALGVSCAPGRVRAVLASSRSDVVRAAAADWLVRATSHAREATEETQADRRALARCVVEERASLVAQRCEGRAFGAPLGPNTRDVLVYVVPDGGERPVPRAPFAVVLPDGAMRCGLADRRGAVFLRGVPDGALELTIPAPLAP
ncbi:MAG: HEAT repeat domain-containing protein [Deltaproteobacteria bacterium]|nr:HEAT repeat domain-containing protein [Deltaproteobacteria bacterium]